MEDQLKMGYEDYVSIPPHFEQRNDMSHLVELRYGSGGLDQCSLDACTMAIHQCIGARHAIALLVGLAHSHTFHVQRKNVLPGRR